MQSENRKKVIIIDNSLGITGAFKAILRNAGDLSEEFNFVFIIPSDSDNSRILVKENFRFYTMPFIEISRRPTDLIIYLPRLIQNSLRLKTLIKKEKASIIHVNDMYNMVGVLAKFLANFKLITHVRRMPDSFPAIIYRMWYYLHKNFSDAVVAVSEANRKYFESHKNVKVVYDSLFPNEVYAAFKAKKGGSTINLLYLANYNRGKGHEHAIEVLRRLMNKVTKKISLNFYGGHFDFPKNLEFRNELELQVKKYKMTDIVTFHNEISDVERIMKKHDIVLNFSDSESFSNVSLEALYYGVPLVATDVGGTQEMFKNGQSGYLVNKYDYESMTNCLAELINKPKLRERLSENSKRFVREKFNYTNTTGALKSIYKHV